MSDAQQHRTRDLGVLSLAVIAPIWGYSWVVSKVALGYARPFTFIAITTAACVICLFLLLLATRRSGVLAGAAGLAWAGGALMVKLLQRRTHIDALSLTAWQMAAGAVPLIAIALVTQSGWPEWTGTFVACLTYAALLSNALCWGLWVVALRSLPAGAAALGTLAVPVVGVVASWMQLGERPTAVDAAGMGLIIAALAVLAACSVISGRRAALTTGGEPSIPPVID